MQPLSNSAAALVKTTYEPIFRQ